MLQVHPDSTCDVCLDPYNFSNNSKTPHAIACGHVFCLECLAHLNHPTSCPLCRKTFVSDRVKKLHIDPHVPGEREAAMPEAWSLAQRLARCARNEVSVQTTELIEEGRRWLEASDHKELFPEVDAVFSALIKYKTLQERYRDQENIITSLTSRLQREEDGGRRDALVEHSLTQKIRELESQLDFYRRLYPGVRDLAWDSARVNSSTSEDRANGASGRSNQGNPLPSPPKLTWNPYTAHNPNFAPSSQDPYRRTSIPPIPSQPYVNQTGAGAVFYEGASHDERVVPPAIRDMAARDAPPEREQARSRSGHSDHSIERRNRRREGESDKTRRRRDHRRRDTLEGAVDRTVLPSEPVLGGNALGFHPSPLRPGQDRYSSVPPAPPVTSDPSSSRARGGSFSRPSTSHGMAPPIAGTASVPGSAYRDASQSNGAGSSYSYRDGPISRPSSTPIGPVLTPWTAPGFANPSMSSLGLSDRSRDVGSTARSQAARPVSTSIPPTARDSVSSWGTAETTSAHSGDLFSTLHPLGSAPADSGLQSNDILPRPDGQLLGVGRYAPIATPQPQLPQAQAYGPSMVRDTDSSRPYSRHAHNPRSQSQTSLPSSRDASQPMPPLFTPDRGFPYASVPPPPPPPPSQPSFPIPHTASQSATSATSTRPSSHTIPMPLTLMASFPSAPPAVNSASRPPSSAPQPYFPSASTPQPQTPSYRY